MFEDDDFEDDMTRDPQDMNEIIQNWQDLMVARMVKENYELMMAKGFNAAEWDQDQIDAILYTIDFMLEQFEATEDYESCARLVKAKQAIEARGSFKPLNI